jgi:hypothetical protein
VAEECAPEGARATKRDDRLTSGPQANKAFGLTPDAAIARPEAQLAVEIAHQTRGRVRLKIPAAKRNPDLLEQIKTASGNVILYYDPERYADVPSFFQSLGGKLGNPTAASLIEATRCRAPQNRVTEVSKQTEREAASPAEHSAIAKAIVEFGNDFDRQVRRATNNHFDLKIMVPIGLAAFTFLEIGAAAATPMWVTWMIFSLGNVLELQAQDDDDQT